MKSVGALGLGGLWAIKSAWHLRESVTNLHKATESKSEIPTLCLLTVSEISSSYLRFFDHT